MQSNEAGLSPQAERNARNAREKAQRLYPLEQWREIETGIFIAESRQPKSKNQERTLEKEIIQARILTALGSAVYLLPEIGGAGVKHPDVVGDGFLIEFKTITGNIREVERHFKKARNAPADCCTLAFVNRRSVLRIAGFRYVRR